MPQSATSTRSDAVNVTEVDIIEERNLSIFGSVTPLTMPGGNWTNHGSSLVWKGNFTMGQLSPLNMTFLASASGVASPSRDVAEFVPSVSLDGWSSRLTTQSAPGFHRGVFLPTASGYKGYNSSTGSSLAYGHTVTSDASYRAISLPGSTTYNAGYFTTLEGSVFGNDIALQSRYVAAGGTLNLSLDLQSVMFKAAELGFTPSVKLVLHPPYGGNAPVYETTIYNGSVLASAAGVPFLSMLDLNGDGVPDNGTTTGRFNFTYDIPDSWLFGPYVVEAEVSWTESVSHTVNGTTVRSNFLRTAHVYDYFVVTPPDLLVPPSPVYDVHLVTWFDDWGR